MLKRDAQSVVEQKTEAARSVQLVRQSTLVLATQVTGLACAVLGNFVLAWMGGPEGKGLIYMLQLIGAVGITVLSFGLGPAAVYYLGRDRNFAVEAAFTGTLSASLLLGSLPLLAFGALRPWWPELATAKLESIYVLIALASIPGMNAGLNMSYYALARQNMLGFNWLRVGTSVLFPFFLLILLLLEVRSLLVIATLWLASVWLPNAYLLWERPRTPTTVRQTVEFQKKAFHFGWRSHLGGVTQYFQHRADVLMVGFLLPLADLGIYSLAVSLAEILWQVPHALSTVLMPHVARGSDEDARRITPAFCRAALAATAVLSLLLAGFGMVVIPLLLPAFRRSVTILCILLPGAVLASVFKVLASDLTGRGRPLETFRPALLSLLVSVVGCLWALPRYGLVGVALVTTIAYATNAALYLRRYTRLTSVGLTALLVPRSRDFFIVTNALRALWSRST